MGIDAVVILASEFGWTLDEIRQLSTEQAQKLIIEIQHQRSIEDYKKNYRVAFLASIIASLLSGKEYTPQDFIGGMPEKEEDKEAQLLRQAKRLRRKKNG